MALSDEESENAVDTAYWEGAPDEEAPPELGPETDWEVLSAHSKTTGASWMNVSFADLKLPPVPDDEAIPPPAAAPVRPAAVPERLVWSDTPVDQDGPAAPATASSSDASVVAWL